MPNLFTGETAARKTLAFIEDKLAAGSWSWDLDTGDMEWSHGMYSLLDYDVGAVAPSRGAIVELMRPDDSKQVGDAELLLRQGLPFRKTILLVTALGNARWIRLQAEPVISAGSPPRRAIGVALDVTGLREVRLGNALLESRFLALADLVDGLVWRARADGKVIDLMNWERLGYGTHEFLGSNLWTRWVHPDERMMTEDRWANAVNSKQRFAIDHRLLQPDGRFEMRHSRAMPVTNRGGEVQEFIGVSIVAPAKQAGRAVRHCPTGAQIRGARAILAWAVQDLASASGVSRSTIRRIEDFDGASTAGEATLDAVRAALEKAGVEFTFAEDGKPGVRPR